MKPQRLDGLREMREEDSLKLCFVALGAYPLFDPAVEGPMGGMESRAWIFARQIARRAETMVSFVVRDFGQSPVEQFDEVTVFARREPVHKQLSRVADGLQKGGRHDAQLPARSAQWLDPALLWRFPIRCSRGLVRLANQLRRGVLSGPALYATIPADVFITFGANQSSAEVVAACRRNQRKSILCLAHDCDLDDVFVTPSRRQRADGVLASDGHLALRQADEIVVQSPAQLTLLRERFGRNGHLVPNPIDLRGDDTRGRPLAVDAAAIVNRGPYVLWVGRSDPVFKRPDVCFEVARKLPTIRFVMVMALANPGFHDELRRTRPPNVDLIDGLPFCAMPYLYRSALLLISTSAQEGFPNTFLQAGKYSIPVVSLNVDTAAMLSVHGGGIVCHGDLAVMAAAVQRLASGADVRRQYAARLLAYVSANHGLEHRCEELYDVIEKVVQRRDERRAGRTRAGDDLHREFAGRASAGLDLTARPDGKVA